MKNLLGVLLLAGMLAVLAVPAFADGVVITLTEGDNGRLLGFAAIPGVVVLCDGTPTRNDAGALICPSVSDLVVFRAVFSDPARPTFQNDTAVTFCSDTGDGDNDPNDHGFVGACDTTSNFVIIEAAAGPDGTENTSYGAPPSAPGGVSGDLKEYNLISDTPQVPEPSSLLLFGSGLVGVVGAMRRKWLR